MASERTLLDSGDKQGSRICVVQLADEIALRSTCVLGEDNDSSIREGGDIPSYFEWRRYGALTWERRFGDRAGTCRERETNGAGGFYRAVEDERIWPPRHEGSRRREEA